MNNLINDILGASTPSVCSHGINLGMQQCLSCEYDYKFNALNKRMEDLELKFKLIENNITNTLYKYVDLMVCIVPRIDVLENHKCKQAEENHAIVSFREELHRRIENLEEFII